MQTASRITSSLAVLLHVSVAAAQFGDGQAEITDAPQAQQTERWKTGISVQAVGGPCQGLFGTVPVPTDWPGQIVKIVDEDISPAVKDVRYRNLDGGVKQMLVRIPRLRGGEKAQALVTFEIERRQFPVPADTERFRTPKKIGRDVRKYLAVSPYIEIRHAEIRSLGKQLVDEEVSAWNQVEKFYDHVRENVEYRNGKLKGALAALRDGYGDCEELTSLFIALCRVNGIPARTVWVPDHCYPEFYLEDQEGKGHWFPCQAAGTRAFGTMPDLRAILQKGDSFRVPEKKERQRYVAEFLTGTAVRGGGRPEVRFIRQTLPVN